MTPKKLERETNETIRIYVEQVTIPDSILVRIDLAHLRNASSTFSPVSALVSKNIRSTKYQSKLVNIPDSIFDRIDLAHLRNASSTFSPVRALVSRNNRSTKIERAISCIQLSTMTNLHDFLPWD